MSTFSVNYDQYTTPSRLFWSPPVIHFLRVEFLYEIGLRIVSKRSRAHLHGVGHSVPDALLYRVDHSDLDIELQEAGPPENLT